MWRLQALGSSIICTRTLFIVQYPRCFVMHACIILHAGVVIRFCLVVHVLCSVIDLSLSPRIPLRPLSSSSLPFLVYPHTSLTLSPHLPSALSSHLRSRLLSPLSPLVLSFSHFNRTHHQLLFPPPHRDSIFPLTNCRPPL